MAFKKFGSPQPIEVLPELCHVCNQNKAEFNDNGKVICSSCRNAAKQPDESNDESSSEENL